MTTTTEIQMVPVDAITVLNPRARNRRVFHELVSSIAHLGLKKPITVSSRGTEPEYDLVCGQGRLEAFIALGQSEIPAIVIEASEEDCYVMSLVENLARRHPGSLELMREIGALKERGYSNAEIAAKIDFTPDYIAAICYLLEHGEERLLAAVERGVMPANIAMEIARAPPTAISSKRSPRHTRTNCCPGTKSWPFGGSFCSAISAAKSPTEAAAHRTPERLPRRR
jgi:ParB family transcriptional regulator, chromosome partitioning protein